MVPIPYSLCKIHTYIGLKTYENTKQLIKNNTLYMAAASMKMLNN